MEKLTPSSRPVPVQSCLSNRLRKPNIIAQYHRSLLTDFLRPKSVDDGRLPRIWITDHPNADLLAVFEKRGVLSKEGDETALAEAVFEGSMEGKGGMVVSEVSDPGSLCNML